LTDSTGRYPAVGRYDLCTTRGKNGSPSAQTGYAYIYRQRR